MKKFLALFLMFIVSSQISFAQNSALNSFTQKSNVRSIKSLLKSQTKYANKENLNKFISTYSDEYSNGDGFNLETYSKLVQDLWNSYDNIKYEIKIKDITVDGDYAQVQLEELSSAKLFLNPEMNGELKSKSNSVYYLKKINGKWKIYSDKVLDEDTSMLYGEAINLDIKLSAPLEVEPDYEYTASLEFTPPQDTLAIASIAKDKVEYPQKQVQEVFRRLPEDNLLERLFISNSDNVNEYVVASIGLTKADINDLSIKLSLTGFGYKIIRVNVVKPVNEASNDKNK